MTPAMVSAGETIELAISDGRLHYENYFNKLSIVVKVHSSGHSLNRLQ